MSKLFVCINLMVEGVGNIINIFNRRPIVFKKLIMFNVIVQIELELSYYDVAVQHVITSRGPPPHTHTLFSTS